MCVDEACLEAFASLQFMGRSGDTLAMRSLLHAACSFYGGKGRPGFDDYYFSFLYPFFACSWA